MAVKILDVTKGSIADKKGIKAGFVLNKINSHEITDILDYQFYLSEKKLKIEFQDENGKTKKARIKKPEYEDIGLQFETYLMDKQHSCKNKCIFCFIDQLPDGMRESLYFKDDDSRLSFFFGNYITLTNLSEHDVDRIIEMHISPVNISVHTMNPELRVEMMANPNAGKSLDIIYKLAKNGIKMNTQLVLCHGINDGDELKYSIEKLSELYPAVQSVAAVPFGMTKYREGLKKIEPYNSVTSGEVIDIIESFGDEFFKKHHTRLVYPADEFYLKADREIPDEAFYEDFSQLENGVGMWAYLKSAFYRNLKAVDGREIKRKITIATGTAAYPLLKELADAVEDKFEGFKANVVAIKNNFFGETINVSGLVTGRDLIEQLKNLDLGDEVLVPSSMLRYEDNTFLDDVTLEQAEKELNIKISPVSNEGGELLDCMLGE
ncbi:MAG: DUF512 domain-containing protein [Clostridiales bacterium]|nr:DUF512 domain-containing protein [Clostridiales bacterium]